MKIAIISDIHEDVESLKKAISIIEKNNVDKVVCLGDIVGFSVPYYPFINTRNASECISIIKANCEIVVAVNQDIYESKKTPQNKAGFDYPRNWYSLNYKERESLAESRIWLYEKDTLPSLINNKETEYLYNLPEYKIAEFDDIRILFSHFVYPDVLGTRADFNMQDNNSFVNHIKFLKENNCALSFGGHGHFEGVCNFNAKNRNVKSFVKLKIKDGVQAFIGPCIAQGKQKNGFVIFDTNKMELDVISLKQKKNTNFLFKKA